MTIPLALKTMEDEIVTLLQKCIPDPLTTRGVGTWVEHGKDHYLGKTPNIIVQRASIGNIEYTGSGNTQKDYEVYFNLLIKVAAGAGGDIDGTVYNGLELLNPLTGKVIQLLDNWVTQAATNSVTMIAKELTRVGDARYSWDPEANVHYNVVQIKSFATQEDLT